MARRITEITRRKIQDVVLFDPAKFWWAGRLEEPDFLARIYDLGTLPSTDDRFRDAYGDIWQHRVSNDDWENDWIFRDERFGLEHGRPDERLLRFLAEMLHPAVQLDATVIASTLGALNEVLWHDGYELYESDRISGESLYSFRRVGGFHSDLNLLLNRRSLLGDPQVLQEHLRRIEREVDTDPAGAIGACKELVESLCKLILEHGGRNYATGDDLMKLYKNMAQHLQLNAEAVPDDAKGSAAAQGVLRAMVSTVQRLAELRNELGRGHGRAKTSSLQSRHGRLALNSTIAIAEFLLETWYERSKKLVLESDNFGKQ